MNVRVAALVLKEPLPPPVDVNPSVPVLTLVPLAEEVEAVLVVTEVEALEPVETLPSVSVAPAADDVSFKVTPLVAVPDAVIAALLSVAE